MATHTAMAQGSNAMMRSLLEQRVGIIHFVSTKDRSWSGQSRTRYTDFLVNEITKDGKVVHLHDFHRNARELSRAAASQHAATQVSAPKPSKPDDATSTVGDTNTVGSDKEHTAKENSNPQADHAPSDKISDTDIDTLVDLVGQTAADQLIVFFTKIQQNSKPLPNAHEFVTIPAIGEKSKRSQIHGEIRRIFSGKIETVTGTDDSIKATAARKGNMQRGRRTAHANDKGSRQNLPVGGTGPFLHFSLYKENKDTMDALSHMAKILRIQPKAFGAAGTKDRRAVTVQRVSIKGRNPASLISVNERINSIKIGDFKYDQEPIRLSDHEGNEFVIVLKNCTFGDTDHLSFEEKLSAAKSTIDSALAQLIQHGFINYYGTQRFGTHQIGTQEIGMKILQEDFAGAIQLLLSYDPLLLEKSQDQDHIKGAHREDIDRARACSFFLERSDSKAALQCLPPRCHVERNVIQHLGKNPSDFVGALMSISRSMRTMYGHAYQSLVWNFVASKRWERFGAEVVNGDLVLVKSASAAANDDVREKQESLMWEDDIAAAHDSAFVPHAVTEDDLQDEKFSMYDVVLPSPGWDVIYPPNGIGDFYVDFMGKPENGGLDPHNMRRRQRDFSLPGSYRKLMGKPNRVPTASVQAYSSDLEQLVPTDLDLIRSRKAEEAAKSGSRQQIDTTAWHKFAQDVRQEELEQSKRRAAQREAEGPAPSVRINDTWVQTSVDGISNKRIKIAKHTNVLEDETGHTTGGDSSIQTEDSAQDNEPAEAKTDAAVVNQQNKTDELKDQQAPPQQSVSTGSETTAYNISQPIPQMTTSNDGPPRLEIDLDLNEGSTKPRSLNDSDHSTPIVAQDGAKPPENETNAHPKPTDTEKIAVVLRFALDTSQYATIVLRELQGAPAANNDPA
ncbi:pseudouridine synthase [Nemania sp. FL0916]|nr:pseudouridine synthase [Nemania sp. FL0916]